MNAIDCSLGKTFYFCNKLNLLNHLNKALIFIY